ncbi:hypothetical protein Q73A0000_05570 [Kaistella flava (ex Peng et al. 2021)]|uniref:Uncharacterized protein n=2 Tax=Kaistella flava (ex Peng et al. 2021) TaxID=2038776 RepID=A0A7M2Y6J4_9FLAO|nr:hypothetical protein Q73A0000_05570 [Kaistella flava (ex Peng et al. 2021)]
MTSQNQISIIFIFLIIVSCNKKNDEWTQTNFDKNISQNDSIKMMNKLYDPEEFYNDSISGNKKTSFITYDNDYNKNVCEAELIKDTLNISIGFSSGFSSKGFRILYHDKKYKIEPYYGTDNIAVFVDDNGKEVYEEPPKHYFKNQKLVLNKTQYKKGDSIYGYVDFSSLEVGKDQNLNHSGKGYFKTKIE